MTAASLSERVRALRKARGLTQAQLAEKARMERTDINRVESGSLGLGRERLARVAAALDVSVLELQPETPPDERGQDLLDRLAELSDTVADLLERQKKTEQSLARLRSRLRTLEAPYGAASSVPRRR